MNYSHAYHAGNFADIVKHAALLAVLGRMQAGATSLRVIDTHGGRGLYDLSASEARRSAEAERGVARLMAAEALPAQVLALREAGFTTMAHEVLKTAPRGTAADHPRIELLRHKGMAVMKAWPVGAWMGTAKAKDRVVTALRAAAPLSEWLTRNVG